MKPALCFAIILIAFETLGPPSVLAQSKIVLRDLSTLPGRSVASFNLETITLDNGIELSWDQVLRATVEPDRQADFDRNVLEIGLPLFRLKKRIAIGDWTRLNHVADQLLSRYSGADSTTAKLVCLAAAKGKWESGARSEAVLPWLMACHKKVLLSDSLRNSMNVTAGELSEGITAQLLPVWHDLNAVRQSKKAVDAYLDELEVEFPTGGYLYLASFALTLKEFGQAKAYLDNVNALEPNSRQWKALLQSEIDRQTRVDTNRVNLFRVDSQTRDGPRAVSLYFDAAAAHQQISETGAAAVVLEYLKVVALWGEQFPSLSSSAIYHAIIVAKEAKMVEEAETLSSELLRRFPNSYHSSLVKTQKISRR